jgi:hypothetical protein
MTDNGAAMQAQEFRCGLHTLGIVHETTLPYSPYQNAKQEIFWATLEGRLMAMLEGLKELTLQRLNEITQVWVEQEYHQRRHAEIGMTPLQRYLGVAQVGRECPDSATLQRAFCTTVSSIAGAFCSQQFENMPIALHKPTNEYFQYLFEPWDYTRTRPARNSRIHRQHTYATGPKRHYFTRLFRSTGPSFRPSWLVMENTYPHTLQKNLTSI